MEAQFCRYCGGGTIANTGVIRCQFNCEKEPDKAQERIEEGKLKARVLKLEQESDKRKFPLTGLYRTY